MLDLPSRTWSQGGWRWFAPRVELRTRSSRCSTLPYQDIRTSRTPGRGSFWPEPMECQSLQSQRRILWTTGPRGPCMPLETKTFWISWGPAASTGDTSSLAHYEFEETAFSPRNRDEGAASRPLGKWAGPHKKRCLIDAWVWTRQRNPKALRQRRPAPSTQRGTRQRGMGYLWARQVPQIALVDGNLEARCISGSSADRHRETKPIPCD